MVEVEGTLVSKPYVDMTLAVMRAFGAQPSNHKYRRFNIEPSAYTGRTYAIEPDASAASYFFAAAAICGGTVRVAGLGRDSLQGDLAFVDVLEHMGCTVTRGRDATTVTGGPLRGVDVDMNAISDTVMTLAAVALCRRRGDAHPQCRAHPAQGNRPPRRAGGRAAPSSARPSRNNPTAWSWFLPSGSRRRGSRPMMITVWPWLSRSSV